MSWKEEWPEELPPEMTETDRLNRLADFAEE
mgnify:FL=1